MGILSKRQETNNGSPPGLKLGDFGLLYLALGLWVVIFVAGTLINSLPYRANVAALEGDLLQIALNGVIVIATFTYTNVAILCVLAGLLGTLGRQSQLGADAQREEDIDTVNPRSSAVLRGFLVYLGLIAGVLVFVDNPIAPTQTQYIRLAGLISLLSFVVNARPSMFGKLLCRMGDFFENEPDTNT